jgi:hypothetical protein
MRSEAPREEPSAESGSERPHVAVAPPPAPRANEKANPVEVEGGPWMKYALRLGNGSLTERFVEATRLLLGTPYHDGPLGEGDAGGPDPDPRYDFERADCVTYLEEALALSLASEGMRFLEALDAIRYRGGSVTYADRNHYMVLDWVPANAWIVEDVTREIGGAFTQTVHRTIDRAAFLREHGAEPRETIDDRRELSIEVIPIEALARVEPALRSGDLVFWVGKREGICVVHTGLAVRSEKGELLHRHASSKAGQALDESFADYAGRASFAVGFMILRVRDGATVASGARGE